MKECARHEGGSISGPLAYEADMLPKELQRPVLEPLLDYNEAIVTKDLSTFYITFSESFLSACFAQCIRKK